jgi:hypothetical protein
MWQYGQQIQIYTESSLRVLHLFMVLITLAKMPHSSINEIIYFDFSLIIFISND